MSTKITITAGTVRLEGQLNDTETARSVAAALPISGKVLRWGQEAYFEVPVAAAEGAEARAEMAAGEIAYWPDGKAVCIFFGRTPASGPDGAPRAASPVEPIGRVLGDAASLDAVSAGTKITITPQSG